MVTQKYSISSIDLTAGKEDMQWDEIFPVNIDKLISFFKDVVSCDVKEVFVFFKATENEEKINRLLNKSTEEETKIVLKRRKKNYKGEKEETLLRGHRNESKAVCCFCGALIFAPTQSNDPL